MVPVVGVVLVVPVLMVARVVMAATASTPPSLVLPAAQPATVATVAMVEPPV